MNRLAYLIAHPELIAALVVCVRLGYALVSAIVKPYPRARAAVEAVAALGPDVLRAAQQTMSAVTGSWSVIP